MRIYTWVLMLALAALTLGAVHADPVMDSLRSFCVVVPEFSKSSGGFSPAVSRDGKTLAFCSLAKDRKSLSDVWILRDDRLGTPTVSADGKSTRPEPWKLEFPEIQAKDYLLLMNGVQAEYSTSALGVQLLDWSKDGRLALVRGIELFVTDSFDYANNTAKLHVVARGLNLADYPDPKDAARAPQARLESPRWSPDGKKIAYLRAWQTGRSASLCVLDIASGVETVVAEDVAVGASAYSQPWSPDGKYLVYARAWKMNFYQGDGICVVSADGKERREVVPSSKSMPGTGMGCPSWSPTSDTIAYCGYGKLPSSSNVDSSVVMSANTCLLRLVDSTGANLRLAYDPKAPSSQMMAAMRQECLAEAARRISAKYGSQLAPLETESLMSGRLSEAELASLARLCVARMIGGEFFKTYEKYNRPNMPSSPGYSMVMQALSKLPPNQVAAFTTGYYDDISESLKPMSKLFLKADSAGVLWSPDGSKVAVIRNPYSQDGELAVADVKTGTQRVLIQSARIMGISWMPDGTALIVSGSRLAATTPGSMTFTYPEVLYLGLK